MTVFILQFKHSIKSYHLNCLYQFPLPFLLHYKRKAEIVFCKRSLIKISMGKLNLAFISTFFPYIRVLLSGTIAENHVGINSSTHCQMCSRKT